jgi:hypothetical protein
MQRNALLEIKSHKTHVKDLSFFAVSVDQYTTTDACSTNFGPDIEEYIHPK